MRFLLLLLVSLSILGTKVSVAGIMQQKDKAKYKQYKIEAEQSLSQGNILKAKEYFQLALQNKPGDKKVMEQLQLVEATIAKKFNEIVALGEQKFKEGDLPTAKKKFEEALLYKPKDATVLKKITNCNSDVSNTFVKTYGGRSYDEGKSVVRTGDGGYIIAGRASTGSSSNTDMLLLKVGKDGNKVWESKIGGDETDEAADIITTSDGNYLAVGHSDSYGGKPGMKDVWAVKVNKAGEELWNKTFGSDITIDEATAVTNTKDGGYLLVGNSFIEGSLQIQALKIDANGEKIWDKYYGGDSSEEATGVIPTEEGFLVVGNTESKGKGKWDIWLLNIDKEGNQVWDMTYGGGDNETGNAIIPTADGGYLIAGSTYSFAYASQDCWLVKVDNKGKKLWAKAVGWLAAEEAFSVVETNDGDFMVIGFQEVWDEEEQAVSSNGHDVFLVKIASDGNVIWERSVGGSNDQRGFDGLPTADGGFLITGYSREDRSGVDVMILKVNSVGLTAQVK